MDKNSADYLVTLVKVFESFKERNLECRPEKVNLLQIKIDFLGVVTRTYFPRPRKNKISYKYQTSSNY